MPKKPIDLSDVEEPVDELEIANEITNSSKGRITQVTYRRAIKRNLGNFENEDEEVTLTCTVGFDETAEEVFQDLAIMAYDMLFPDDN